MEQVPMNDGLDGRETIAFGLGAGEVAAFVLALMTAYAVIRSGLAGVVAWPVAGLVAGGGAALAWGRLAGRPMLEWAVLLAGFMVRTAPARAARTRRRLDAWSAGLRARASEVRLRVLPRVAAVAPGQGGAVVLPLALRRLEPTAAARTEVPVRPPRAGSHVVGFFSLAGGAGRTTLAVELAAAGAPGRRVVLLDLARRNPVVVAGRGGPGFPRGACRRRERGRGGCRLRLRPRRPLPRPAGALRPAAGDADTHRRRRARRLSEHGAAAPPRPA
jgi:hypothetical protein